MFFLTGRFGVTRDDSDRDLAAEQADIAQIVERVLHMQASAAAEQQRPLARGTHAKGVCARARFEVFDPFAGRDHELGARLAHGLFTKHGSYPATVRFANSDPKFNPDFRPDVRSLSISVELPPGGPIARQDFSLQSAPTLPINDARAFVATIKLLTASSPLKALWALEFQDKLRVLRTVSLAQLQAHQSIKPYQRLRYRSTVPFLHGATGVTKYCATPEGAKPIPLMRWTRPIRMLCKTSWPDTWQRTAQ